MLRFILVRRIVDECKDHSCHFTIDCELPEIEAALTAGGFGEMGSDITALVGVEVIQNVLTEGGDDDSISTWEELEDQLEIEDDNGGYHGQS